MASFVSVASDNANNVNMCIIRRFHTLRCDTRPLVTVAWDPTQHIHIVAVDPYAAPLPCDADEPGHDIAERPVTCSLHSCCKCTGDILRCECFEGSDSADASDEVATALRCPCSHEYHSYRQHRKSSWPQLPIVDGWVQEIPRGQSCGQIIPGTTIPCTTNVYRLVRGTLLESGRALRFAISLADGIRGELQEMLRMIDRLDQPDVSAQFDKEKFMGNLLAYLTAESGYKALKTTIRFIDLESEVPYARRLPEFARPTRAGESTLLDWICTNHPRLLRCRLNFPET